MIDRQGLLHVGDAIREVNGTEVHSPEELQAEIARARESVTLRVVPSYELEAALAGQVKSSTSTAVHPPVHEGTTTQVSGCLFTLILAPQSRHVI